MRTNMGLDITFFQRRENRCPHCNEVIGHTVVSEADAGGRGWYPLLESLGYYVSYDQRTEENDWNGKDMVLTSEQASEVFKFATSHPDLYGSIFVRPLIAMAKCEGDDIVLYASW